MNFTRNSAPIGNAKPYNAYGGIGARPAATARALSRRTASSQGSPLFVQKNTGKPTEKDDDDFKAEEVRVENLKKEQEAKRKEHEDFLASVKKAEEEKLANDLAEYNEAAKKAAEEAAKKAAEEEAKQLAEEAAKAEEEAKKAAEEAAKQAEEEAAKKAAEEEAAKKASEESAPAPAEESAPAPAEESTPAPAEESTPAPAEESAPAPAEESAPAPDEESAPTE